MMKQILNVYENSPIVREVVIIVLALLAVIALGLVVNFASALLGMRVAFAAAGSFLPQA